MQIQGIPYVPGRVYGRLRRRGESFTDDDIVLLTQSHLRTLRDSKPAALIVVDGAPCSHTLIQWLSDGIPLVIINSRQAERLPAQGYLQLDGNNGEITTVAPGCEREYHSPSLPAAGRPVTTADGVSVHLNASVSSAQGAARALINGAAAVGLVRSEFLQPTDARIPDNEFYRQAFNDICTASKPLAITIRLLDLAPDKKPPWLHSIPEAQVPTGLQGVRLYRYEPVAQVVRAQLTAIAPLADEYELRLLIPYVSLPEEYRHWRQTIHSVIAKPLAVGAMLETPAAVLDIGYWVEHADFVGIGCNDLMQNLFAADRDLPQLKSYLNPYSPALMRLLRQTARSAGERIDKIQLCGLLPQWPGILPLLIGMGFVSFSIEPLKIPYLAQTVIDTSTNKLQPVIDRACNAADAHEVCRILNVPVWPDS